MIKHAHTIAVTVPAQKMAHVFDYFVEYEGLMEAEDVFLLSLIAKMSALSMTCEGFDLDRVRHTAVLGEIIGLLYSVSAAGDQPQPSSNAWVTIAISGYSMPLGGVIWPWQLLNKFA